MTVTVLSGNHAQSEAVRLARVQVVSAYPITPQTTIVEGLAEHVASGAFPGQFVKVESEHSALQVCLSASALGARTYTATSSQGLLLMHELLHWATGLRAPIVMGVVNRAVAPPWSLGADHTDTVAQRDTGWIQLYAEDNQEVLDMVLEAYRLAEDPAVRLPAMVTEDAFYLSHTVEPVDVPAQEVVDRFLPAREAHAVLRPPEPLRLGSFTGPPEYVRFRHELAVASQRVVPTLLEVEHDFARLFGRQLGGAVEPYRTDGADAVLVTLGTASTVARAAVDALREEGKKVGMLKLRLLRPLPEAALRSELDRGAAVGVFDRSYTFGAGGAVATEVRAALYRSTHAPPVTSFVGGIGGREVTVAMLRGVLERLLRGPEPGILWTDLAAPQEARTNG